MAVMRDEASELMRRLLNIRFEEVGLSEEMAGFAKDWLFPPYCEEPIVAVLTAYLVPRHCQIETGKPSEEAIELLKQLLALHYIDGGVPAPIVALVETSLKAVNAWFHDPQHPYLEGEGYVGDAVQLLGLFRGIARVVGYRVVLESKRYHRDPLFPWLGHVGHCLDAGRYAWPYKALRCSRLYVDARQSSC